MPSAQVTATGGAHGDMPLRPPPQDYQQQRTREEIELAESLLDHRHGSRDTSRHFSQDQQPQQQMMQHPPPQQQQQQLYQQSRFPAHDDRRSAQPSDSPRSQQTRDLSPSGHQSSYPMHPHPHPHHQPDPRTPTPGAQASATTPNGQYCSNCGTTKTPLWRRSQLGQTICNACGLYEKARNTARPPNLKRPPSYAPAFSNAPVGDQDPENQVSGNTYVSAQSQPCRGTCPGDGKCNGTGGSAACDGCPAFNNRVSKTAQLALNHARRTSPTTTSASADPEYESTAVANAENVVIACQNCHTTTTPLWRRDMDGHTICNACGLYYKLHGQHRPVEMKKSFIKRRKRVAPALVGQDIQHVSNHAASASEISTSPEASTAHAAPAQHPDGWNQPWSQRNHARNPVEPQPNIDPTLDRSHYPPPVDFTPYNSREAPPAPQQPQTAVNSQHESIQQSLLNPASPKRRHEFSPPRDQQINHDRHEQRHSAEASPAPSIPRPIISETSPSVNEDEEIRRKKRTKREQLMEKMRKMQEEITALGNSDDEL